MLIRKNKQLTKPHKWSKWSNSIFEFCKISYSYLNNLKIKLYSSS